MGSSRAALLAGIIPDKRATIKQRPSPSTIHNQGTINALWVIAETPLPIKIPASTPKIPPICAITIASTKN